MSDGTSIEWTDATWNVINGCTRVSPGCGGPGPHGGCYAERLAATRLKNHPSREGLAKMTNAGPRWTGEVRFNEPILLDPLHWRRPRKVFVCAHGDLFHEAVPVEWIDRIFTVMSRAPQHTFQVLTKRPERMRAYMSDWSVARCDSRGRALVDLWEQLGTPEGERVFEGSAWPLPNVWLGTSVEDQKRAQERVPVLLDTLAAKRWLSCEPLLGPVDLTALQMSEHITGNALTGRCCDELGERGSETKIDWVVVGGESGPGSRPMHPAWPRSLHDQCAQFGVPFLFKQWGDWAPGGDWPYLPDAALALKKGFATILPSGMYRGRGYPFSVNAQGREDIIRLGKKAAGRLLDGVQHDGYPA